MIRVTRILALILLLLSIVNPVFADLQNGVLDEEKNIIEKDNEKQEAVTHEGTITTQNVSSTEDELSTQDTISIQNLAPELEEPPTDEDEYKTWKQKLVQNFSFNTTKTIVRSLLSSQTIRNDFIEYMLSNGRYTIGTTGGNPDNVNDDNKIMLYGHPSPSTSYTTLKIDGQDIIYSPTNQPINDTENLSSTTESNTKNMNIKQTVSIVKNASTKRDDTVQIKYTITNNDSVSHSTGVRIMMDTMLGNNDAAPFRVPGIGSITTEKELTGEEIPEYWQVFDNLQNPSVIAQGTLLATPENKPDRVQFTNWSRVYRNPWDYTVNPGYSNGDSAVSVYWDPASIAPGETKEYVTFYGLSEFVQDLRPPLALSLTGATIVESTEDGEYNPNPFTVTAYIMNNSNVAVNDAKINLELPEGLKLAEGQNEIELDTLQPGREKQVSWKVEIEPADEERKLTYSVILGPKVVTSPSSSNNIARSLVASSPQTWESKKVSRDIKIPPAKTAKNLVIFIPGTGGSSLYDSSGGLVWLNPARVNGLSMDHQLYTKEQDTTFFYNLAPGTLRARGNNVYTFTYDWRKSIEDNTLLLKSKIDEFQKSGIQKVDIVAHSLGCLLATNYTKQFPSKVRKLINVGAPYYGAPETLYQFKSGSLMVGLWDDTLKTALPTMPSLYEMLPSRNYFSFSNNHYFEKGSYNWDYVGKPTTKQYKKYATFNEMKQYLQNTYNAGLVSNADTFQSQLSPDVPGVEVWNIVGDGKQTIGCIYEKGIFRKYIDGTWRYDTTNYDVRYVNGDGTVPLVSANRGLTNRDKTFYISSTNHRGQMGNVNILEKIDNILKGQPYKLPSSGVNDFRTSYKKVKGLALTINSPVDLHIYDINNNHMGPNDNGFDENIENANYWMIDHNKFAALPEGEYDVKLNATDTGVFSFTIEAYDEDEVIKKVYFKDIPVQKGQVVYSKVGTTLDNILLNIDKDNDGNIDGTIQPSFVGDASAANDKDGPDFEVNIVGEKGNDNWYKSDVAVTMSANDNEGVGVNKIEYKINNDSIKPYSSPILFKNESVQPVHLEAIAEDKIGNYSGLEQRQFRIDKSTPKILSTIEGDFMLDDTLDLSKIKVEDNISGIAKVDYYVDEQVIKESKITLSKPGIHTLKVIAEDNAGNSSIFAKEFNVYIPATISFNPKALKKVKDNNPSVVTAHIELPKQYNNDPMDLTSVVLNGVVHAINDSKYGYVNNGAMVKFKKNEVSSILSAGENIRVIISGQLKSGVKFKGMDTIKVMN